MASHLPMRRDKEYHKVAGDEPVVDEPSDEDSLSESQGKRSHPFVYVLTVVNIAIFVMTLLLFVAMRSGTGSVFGERNCVLKEPPFYSPIYDKMEITSRPAMLTGTLADEENPPSIYRQPPSPEVDAEWKRLAPDGFIILNTSEITRLGKDPSKTARAPVEWGYGPDAHLGRIDAFHQIHCLDVLRRRMFPDYYTERKILEDVHPMHCLHLILQNLMCDASVDIITHNWVETQERPFPDMSLNRQCRDYESIIDWHLENKIPEGMGKIKELKMPTDVVPLSLSPQLRKLLDNYEKGEEGVQNAMRSI